MKAKKVATYGILIALAMVFSYLESLFPLTIAVPGVKMGLANTVTIFALYRLGLRDACFLSLIRVTLVAILFGNIFSLAFSAVGATVSLAVMYPMSRSARCSQVTVSMAGGVAHNAGQIIVAIFVTGVHQIAWYFPILCLTGTAAGRRNRPGLRPDPPPDGALGILSPLFAARLESGPRFSPL